MRIFCYIFLFIGLGFVSCRQGIQEKNVFRLNQVQGVESLDPAFAKNLNIMWHVHWCYNRLLEFDENMHAQPSLARSWEISADRKTYTFNLRTDVYFHDNAAFPKGKGRKFTAHDVVYSFSRLLDEQTASPGAWIFNGRVDSLHPFTAINDSTLIIRLSKPFNPMLGILSMQYCSIVPHEVVEKWGKDFRSHPCGTGPFMFTHWENGIVITYVKNPHYWEKDSTGQTLPYIDGIRCSFIDSKATEFLMFMQGDIDFMNGIDVSFKDQVLNKKGELKEAFQQRIRLTKHPYLNVEYLGILLDTNKQTISALLQKKLRQAINYGFDRDKMVTYLRNRIGIPAHAGFIPPGLLGFDSNLVKGYTYQPEKAIQLIQEVKNEIGDIPVITLLSNDNYSDRCNFIASELSSLGLQVRVEIMQPSLLREQMSNANAPFFWATWIADYPDAESYLSLFYGKNDAPPNYTRMNDPNYNELYNQALIEPNEEKKISLYQAMDKIIINEAPCVPLFYDELIHFTQSRVQHFYSNHLNLIELKNVQLQ